MHDEELHQPATAEPKCRRGLVPPRRPGGAARVRPVAALAGAPAGREGRRHARDDAAEALARVRSQPRCKRSALSQPAPPFEGGFGLVHPSRSPHGAPVSVMTGPQMTRPPRPNWPLSSVLPPMGALATAPRTARMHLRDTLKEWDLPELIEDGELIASELVTN